MISYSIVYHIDKISEYMAEKTSNTETSPEMKFYPPILNYQQTTTMYGYLVVPFLISEQVVTRTRKASVH
jgi:hypothetical protein